MNQRDTKIKRERRAANPAPAIAPWADRAEVTRFLTERLHPQTMETLRELVKLHGAPRLIEAIRGIETRS